MRILITGCRFWKCHNLAYGVLQRLMARYGPDLVIVHGGAAGVDDAFDLAAKGLGLAVEPHPVTDQEWDRLGKSAGPRRNTKMVALGADLCIAVHKFIPGSKGTRDCATKAIAAGIPTYLIDSEEAKPKRLRPNDPRLE